MSYLGYLISFGQHFEILSNNAQINPFGTAEKVELFREKFLGCNALWPLLFVLFTECFCFFFVENLINNYSHLSITKKFPISRFNLINSIQDHISEEKKQMRQTKQNL